MEKSLKYVYYISQNGGVPSDYGMSRLATLVPPECGGEVFSGTDYNDTSVFLDSVGKFPPYAIAISLGPNTPLMITKMVKSQARHVDEIVQYVRRHRSSGKNTWQLCVEWLAKQSGKFKLGFTKD